MRRRTVVAVAIALGIQAVPGAQAVLGVQAVLAAQAGPATPAWTTYRHDAARSGIDPDSTRPVTPAFAWQTPSLDGEVYAQPLVYGSTVYVASENNTIYALDSATGAVRWANHLAAPEPATAAPCGDIAPTIGITSTPVINPVTNRLYVVGAVEASDASIHHELFALDLGSGAVVAGFPIRVDPPWPSGGSPVNQLQRAGLALDAGRILIGYGGNDGDCSTYWGWLVSAPTDGTTSLDTFQVDAAYHDGAIWAAGNAPPVDAAGNVYIATGNGSGDSSPNPDYGDSVVKLNALAAPLDWWAPTNWQSLDASDTDLGSSMPTLLPGGYLFQSGKDGNGYLLNGAGLGHVSAARSQATGFCSGGSFGGAVYDPARSTIYAACSRGLRALAVGTGGSGALTPRFSAASGASGPPMIAGGLVWAADSSGNLYGLDPSSGATRTHFSIPEHGSMVNHFASPSAGGGRLFIASGDQVTAYTIATAPGAPATTTRLTATPNPTRVHGIVAVTATVAPAPHGGTVTFTDRGTPIAGCTDIAVSTTTAGRARCATSFASAGIHRLDASYTGDASDAGSSAPGLEVTVIAKPVLSRVSLSPRRVPEGRPALLRFTLSTAATVRIRITTLETRHRVGHRCSTRRRRCTVRVTLRRMHFHAGAGRNAFKLLRRRLPPGRYRLSIYATDIAGRSRTAQIGFTILKH